MPLEKGQDERPDPPQEGPPKQEVDDEDQDNMRRITAFGNVSGKEIEKETDDGNYQNEQD